MHGNKREDWLCDKTAFRVVFFLLKLGEGGSGD